MVFTAWLDGLSTNDPTWSEPMIPKRGWRSWTEKPRSHGTPSGTSQQSGSDRGKGNGGHDHGHHGK